ncbi:rhodanese-like domain-containing protein [Tenacibaculum todarodis]|uniref:Rhodanese-like domain-containing protein n=1 Tax=Tenacibaculum todarodis TaxID=1850252 RepID=A0A1L3JM53_9FLAO|nr:rhodanese-like domain-containing protein [Tenacibaculum todarodis]APG66201.1 rhodanese-like domain-containing protein [Tenacibaculum todarodis]
MRSLLCVFLTLFFISCSNSQEIKSITTRELKTILSNDKIQLLDVRTTSEIEQGFIETAVFSDVNKDGFYDSVSSVIDKKKPVYIYCRSGGRSMKASKILQEKGYKVINVLGGYNAWKQEK